MYQCIISQMIRYFSKGKKSVEAISTRTCNEIDMFDKLFSTKDM